MPSAISYLRRRGSWILLIAGLAVTVSCSPASAEPPAERVTPKSIEFAGVEDKIPLGFRDSAALVALLKQVRASGAAELVKDVRRDVGFQELYAQPAAFRGTLIEINGVAQRVFTASCLASEKEAFEVWITIPAQGPNPFACIVEELPTGFPREAAVSQPIIFRGHELASIFGDRNLPFDQANLAVDPGLNYSEVERLVRVLASLNVTKISLAAAEK